MNTPSDKLPPNPDETSASSESTPSQPPPSGAASPPPPPPPSPPPSQNAQVSGDKPGQDQRQWAMFAHLSALIGGLVTAWTGGWGVFIGPLVIWLVKKDEMPFVDDQGKEALNFNITIAIAFVIMLIFSIVTFGVGLLVTVPLWIVISIYWLVVTIIATLRANEGERYRYPLTLRIIN